MNAHVGRPARHFYEFGPFRLDVTEQLLFRDGAVIPLKPKVFETLLVLVESSGHVIERDALMKTLWPDTVVEENNLNQYISALRRALGDGENVDHYIETVPRRGYRFVAEVRESGDAPADLVLEKHTLASIVVEEEDHKNSAYSLLVPFGLTSVNPRVIAASILLGVLVIAGYFLISTRSKQPEAVSAVKSIAVLPFKPLSADANDEYMGLGMTDALITRLGSVNQIVIRSTSAVRKYAAQEQDPVAVGRELKVEAVLDGSIQKVGDRVRLTLQLVRVGDGRQLWTDKFDSKFTDLLTLEDSISERVAGALALKLTGEERKELAKRYTESGEAYILYLRGRYFWNKRTLDAVNKAIEYFQQAIEKDATYALAYAGIADSYVLQGGFFYSAPPTDCYPKAKDAAIKALAIDDQLAEAHTSLALVKTQYDWQWADAENEFKEAIALKPNYPTAHHWYGFYLVAMRRFDEAVAEIKRAQELDPVSLIISTDVGAILFMARRDDQAIEQCQKTLELDPNFIQAHNILSLIYGHQGMYDQWLAERQKVLTLSGNSEDAASITRIYAQSGYRGVWENQLAELKQHAKTDYVQAFAMATAYAQLGDNDRAFEWLEKAYYERSPRMADIRVTATVESLRTDSRFPAFVRRLGLDP
jgi:DNA-binding winged helix-turn-helix (wHTH) protein/TolB-like protein/Tfp pilus assembly protein PilF